MWTFGKSFKGTQILNEKDTLKEEGRDAWMAIRHPKVLTAELLAATRSST